MQRPFYKKKRYLLPIALVLGLALGPRPDFPDFDGQMPVLELSLNEVEAHIAKANAAIPNLKPQNGAEVVWADSVRMTEYVLVYLHGFSASPVEGAPVHKTIAKRFGMNYYAPLLAEHGMDSKESFREVVPKDWVDDAKAAIALGQKLGKKIVLMSCSTGSTLANYISAQNPGLIHAQIMYAPNFEVHAKSMKLLTYPWGRQLAESSNGSEYRKMDIPADSPMHPYWTTEYHINGGIALQDLLDKTMTDETFKAIDEPWMIGYYYKNEEECDLGQTHQN